MRKLPWFAVLAGAAALSIAFVACGSDDDDGGGDGDTTPAASVTEAGGDGGAGSQAISVTAKDFSLSLDKTSVEKGATVEVQMANQGSAPHTITFYADEDYADPVPSADSGQVSGGASTTFSFTAPGDGDDLYYRCEVHPSQMKGELGME